MSLLFFALVAVIALQFSDLLSSYAAYNHTITAASGLLQWFAGKLGLATTLITTKVVIIAIVIAAYVFTKLPWWVYAIVAVYYLYKTGKGLLLWRSLVNAAKNVVDPTPPVSPPAPSPTPSTVTPPPAPVPVPTPSAPDAEVGTAGGASSGT